MTPEQEARLPGYAKRELELLRRKLQGMTTERDDLHRQVSGDPEGSDTFVDDYDVTPTLPLGERPLIRFETTSGSLIVRLNYSKDAVEVRSSRGGLAVSPRASNVIEVRSSRH